MPSISGVAGGNKKPLNNAVGAQFVQSDLSLLTEMNMNDVDPYSSSSTIVASLTPSSCCSLKRRRPPKIEIPQVLRDIQMDEFECGEQMVEEEAICFEGEGVAVLSIKGKKKVREDTYKVVSGLRGDSKKGFFGVYDGHGGRNAAEFVSDNLHGNILEMLDKCRGDMEKDEAIKAGYLKTDQDFLKKGLSSGTCCVTVLIEGKDIAVSNLGDCRAVLCRDSVAEALTKDHRAEQEDERNRIEKNGGFVDIHGGAWRVQGILSVSRSIGDVLLKDWVMAEPDTKILHLTRDMEFLVLASDGLWEKVGNQEAVDTAMCSCLLANKQKTNFNLGNEEEEEFSCENTSFPSKSWGLAQVRYQNLKTLSPSKENDGYNKAGNLWKDEDESGCENTSPLSKAHRGSLIKQQKRRIYSPKENNHCERRPTSCGLMAACKELVNLAVNRGSLDDITVMIIDLKQFHCNS